MLHRYRTAMVRPGRELLSGRVEVDETFLGGEQPGPRGRGALGKTLVVIAVELVEPKGYRRTRRHGRDRRLGCLPGRLPGLVHPRAAPGCRVRIPGARTASGCASRGVPVQALATGHAPRRHAARAHAGLP